VTTVPNPGWRRKIDFLLSCTGDLYDARSSSPTPRRAGRPPGTTERAQFFHTIVSIGFDAIRAEEQLAERPASRILADYVIDSAILADDLRASLAVPRPGATEQQRKTFADVLRHQHRSVVRPRRRD
jgi:hypothetical protein